MGTQRAIYLFPLAFLLNASSMTILLIAAGTMGRAEVAADIAIVQGATLAVFFAFSANARSVILGKSSKISFPQILRARVFLLVPLGGIALGISLYLTEAAPVLALALVLRRCSEWISEVVLARGELDKRYGAAVWFIVTQTLLLVVAMVSIIAEFHGSILGLFLWATLPIMLSIGFLAKHFHAGSLFYSVWIHMLPHFGSTAITGITVFVFRLVILLLVGKAYAGNLFAAFAIGGFLSSVFAQALGPTLVFHAKEGLASDIPSWLKACLFGSVSAGIVLLLASAGDWQLLLETGKPAMFWPAIGASLVGGAVMVVAQRFRLRLLQHHDRGDAFGPDVLTNIFIVACVPYIYYLFGVEALSWLFLINATIAVVFYVSADRTPPQSRGLTSVEGRIFRQVIAGGLLIPMFFQLSGRLFSDRVPILDSGGDIQILPIPISVLICYGAIAALGRYHRARESLSVIFLCFSLMLLATVLSTHDHVGLQEAKIILLIQFILPMLALVLGQTYEAGFKAEASIAKAFLYVMVLVMPLQLVATWDQNLPLLSSYLYIFSVYQHIQYVPLVFVCAFVFCLFSLWSNKRYQKVLMVLAIPAGAYVMLSASLLTVSALYVGCIVFVGHRYLRKNGKDWKGALFLLFIVIGTYGVVFIVENHPPEGEYGKDFFEIQSVVQTGVNEAGKTREIIMARNIEKRIEVWRYYVHEIFRKGREWTFGHETPPDRALYPSAHNYYLDFVYNFGLIALFPIIWLIAFTLLNCGRHWKMITTNPEFFALVGVVLFLLLVDNSLKVGLRQPYSGIITFFLWGVLLSRFTDIKQTANIQTSKDDELVG